MNQNEKQMLVQGITLLETTLSQELTSAKAGQIVQAVTNILRTI
jgi:hypothetical protein